MNHSKSVNSGNKSLQYHPQKKGKTIAEEYRIKLRITMTATAISALRNSDYGQMLLTISSSSLFHSLDRTSPSTQPGEK